MSTVSGAGATALRLSQAVFSAIISIAADAIVSIDEDHRIVLFNEGAERIFGYAAAEAIGLPLDVLLPPGLADRHREHVRRFGTAAVAARRMGTRNEISGRRKNGEVFPAEASISRVEVDGRRVYTAVLRDVTERDALLRREREMRIAAEAAERRSAFLAEASELLDRSLDYGATLRTVAMLVSTTLADLCVIDVLDDEGHVVRLDVATADPEKERIVAQMRQYPRDENRSFITRRALIEGESELVTHLSPTDLGRFAHDDEHLKLLQELAPTSYMAVPLQARGRTLGAIGFVATGARRAYTSTDLALATELGRRAAIVIDNARLYRIAQRAIRGRDDMLGVVSHDLRNPLSTIRMCAAALRDPEPIAPDTVQELADTITQSADWMDRIIRDLVDVASIEAGRLSLHREHVAVRDILDRATAVLEPLVEERSLTLCRDCPRDLPLLHADADRVVQVLSNIIGNACRFTPSGGRITVRASHDGDAVCMSVEDTGVGIPADEQPHVFDRYWHANRGTRRHGSGLGLAIARGIVEAHGGRLWLTSEVGRGSTFYFTIPTEPGTPAAHS